MAPTTMATTVAPGLKRHTSLIVGALASGIVLLCFGLSVGFLAGRASTLSRAPAAATATPTCDVIGVNGCKTKGADGGGPVMVPTATPATPALPAPPPAPTIDDGTWSVGADFPAGTYHTDTAGSQCYWAITTSGSNGHDIVNNHIGGGHLSVTLKLGQDFQTQRCGTWTKV